LLRPPVRPNLHRFARQVAARLPGTWDADSRLPVGRSGRVDYSEVWDGQNLDWATAEFSPWKATVLTGPNDERLLAIAHPRHRTNFIIGALAPPGLNGDPRGDEDAPLAITVPADPARAASLLARRFLPRYEQAAAAVRANAEWYQQPADPLRVEFTWAQDRSPRVTAYRWRADSILSASGFRFNTRTNAYRLPADLGEDTMAGLVQEAALRLGAEGFNVAIRPAPAPTPSPAASEDQPTAAMARGPLASGAPIRARRSTRPPRTVPGAPHNAKR
jgi:hypothetical protein